MNEAQMQRHVWNRISGVLMMVDGLCLILFGRYKSFDLSFCAWQAERSVKKKLQATKGV